MEEASSDTRIRVLELVYADVISERDRLRGARASFTRDLGPLPASAAVAIGLFGSAGARIEALWLVEAAAMLVTLVAIGVRYSRLPPYRVLRARKQPNFAAEDTREIPFDLDERSVRRWLIRKIDLERAICGPLREQNLSLARDVDNLQEALDVELTASAVVRALFVAIIIVLVTGLAMRGASAGAQLATASGIAGITLLALIVAFRYWRYRPRSRR